MLREVGLFGALAPSLLLYFLAAVALFLVDRLASRLGAFRLFWHPPLARLALFVCLFSGLVLFTRP